MSLMPSREDQAFSAGYSQASKAGGMVIDHMAARLREAEVQRDALAKALTDMTAAFDGLRPFPLVIDAVAQGLISQARAALSGAPVGSVREPKT